jgi:hypothetical protein
MTTPKILCDIMKKVDSAVFHIEISLAVSGSTLVLVPFKIKNPEIYLI